MSNCYQDLGMVNDEVAVAIEALISALDTINKTYKNPVDKILGKSPAVEVFWTGTDIETEANDAYDATHRYVARLYLPVIKMVTSWKLVQQIAWEMMRLPLSNQNLGGLCYWWRTDQVTPIARTNLPDDRIAQIGLECEYIVKRGEI